MNQFLSCDWGTTSFRLRLVDARSYSILGKADSENGILSTFNLWKTTGNGEEKARLHYYLNVISEQIKRIEHELHISTDGIPLVISGMASSTVGMLPLPYQDVPFPVDGSHMHTRYIPADATFHHDLLLISGIRSDDDVMRGEETQLIGCVREHLPGTGDQIYIFPGTHSKHITVKNGNVVGFKTYMTGEFFSVLSTQTILREAVESPAGTPDPSLMSAFQQGIIDSQRSNLLHACFKVRTNSLFQKMGKHENFYYLSGLLIGTEISQISKSDASEIYLCCGSGLRLLYETGFRSMHIFNVQAFQETAVEEAVIRGQSIILNNSKNHE